MKAYLRIALLTLIPATALAATQFVYTADSRFEIPRDYREWVFLTSSIDLNYNTEVPGAGTQSLLDNVFVNPDSYQAFLKTGKWPDKTIFVKENRVAASAGTIARSGKFQQGVASIELHVKDEARFPGRSAFFVSDGKEPARLMPPSASCYQCHADHGAVENTFVQFYPTLMDIATAKGTVNEAYLKEAKTLAGQGHD